MTREHKFDDKQARKLRKEYEGGAPLRELAEKYGSSVPTIRNAIYRVGGQMRTKQETAKPIVPRSEWPTIVKMYQDGATLRAIGIAYNTSVSNIQYYLEQSKATPRPRNYSAMGKKWTKFNDDVAKQIRQQYEDGSTVEGLANLYSTSGSTISRTIRRVGGTIRTTSYRTKSFDEKTAKEMRKAYEEGGTIYTLAATYGSTPGTISRTLKSVGTEIRDVNTRQPRGSRRRMKTGLLGWLNQ